MGFGFVVWF